MIIIFETLINKFAWNGILNLTFIIINMVLSSFYMIRGHKLFIGKNPDVKLFQFVFISLTLIESILYLFALYTWYYSDSYEAVREIGFYGYLSDIFYIVAENYRAEKNTVLLLLLLLTRKI